ncbi:hypothetical protein HPULCUR_001836 [Helicostylum pulchrum]|uniref:Uncharacterized protein n=1 Tax=Helicostylum pulchrum TaxID=562976 RepID=A0ABP9XNS9_9FUNG
MTIISRERAACLFYAVEFTEMEDVEICLPKFQRNIPTLRNELRTVIPPAAIENHTLNVEVDDSGAITNPLPVIYFEGHEREDVVTYRKEWSQRIIEYQRYAETFGYEDVSVAISPALPDNIRRISLYRIEISILKNDRF